MKHSFAWERPTRLLPTLFFLVALSGCSALQSRNASIPTAFSGNVSATLLAMPEASLQAGQYDDALRQYQAIVAHDPNNDLAKLGIAEVQLASDNTQTALDLFTELAKTPNIHGQALQGKGLALIKMRRNEEAQKALVEAVAVQDTLWRAWNALGILYDGAHDWDKADNAYRRALSIVPDSAIIENNYGFSLMLRKDFPAAMTAFEKALRLAPDLNAAQMNLRILLAMEGHYQEAVNGIQGKETAAILNNVGFAAMVRGDYKNAETYLVQAQDASPSQYEAASTNLQRVKFLTGSESGGVVTQSLVGP